MIDFNNYDEEAIKSIVRTNVAYTKKCKCGSNRVFFIKSQKLVKAYCQECGEIVSILTKKEQYFYNVVGKDAKAIRERGLEQK